jgi:hypothetical protein
MLRNKYFSHLDITCFMFHIHLWPIYWLSLVASRTTFTGVNIKPLTDRQFCVGLGYDAISISDYVVSNGRRTGEQWTEKDLDESCHGLIEVLYLEFPWRGWEKPHKNLRQNNWHPSHNLTWAPPRYIFPEHYCYADLLFQPLQLSLNSMEATESSPLDCPSISLPSRCNASLYASHLQTGGYLKCHHPTIHGTSFCDLSIAGGDSSQRRECSVPNVLTWTASLLSNKSH